jgi:hypothetical protein
MNFKLMQERSTVQIKGESGLFLKDIFPMHGNIYFSWIAFPLQRL